MKTFSGSYDAEKLAKILNDSSLNFKYSTVEKATGYWNESNKLGQGGFGTVYKVVLYTTKWLDGSGWATGQIKSFWVPAETS